MTEFSLNGTNGARIARTVERKPEIRHSRPKRHTALRAATESLSRRNLAAAHCEVLNEALQAVTALCYEADQHGQPWNVDGATGRILIPLPCGRIGRSRWGLRRTEADALRLILWAYQNNKQIAPLYMYDPVTRSWHLNVWDYPTRADAEQWLQRCQVTPSTWLQATDRLRDSNSDSNGSA